MINSKLKELLLVAGESLLLVAITLAAVVPFSCKITEQGVKLLGGDYAPPVLNDFTVINEKCLQLDFSEKVTVSGCVVAKAVDEYFDSMEHSDNLDLSPAIERASGVYGAVSASVTEGERDGLIQVLLQEPMEIGQLYEFYSVVCDENGNSLTLVLPFTGFNSRIPKLLITEVQTESVSSQNKTEKQTGCYRNEFVEFLVLEGGNLAGLELCSAYDGEAKKYLFPPIEVQTGELFILHMRKRGEGCISEEEDDFALAYSSYTNDQVRDLWTELESTSLGNKTDILILRNCADGKLLDALMYRASNIESWPNKMIEYSQLIDEAGIYASGDIENAFITDSMTSTKTMVRKDAALLLERVLAGEEFEYPLSSSAELWELPAEVSPGSL